MASKVLRIEHEKCTGCRLCELVCAVRHDGSSNPTRARIRVLKWEADGIYVPVACQQCEDAPCKSACPVGAIVRDEEPARVAIDHDKCIGCRTCVSVCPFGGVHFVPADRKVVKCDLCDGDPQCVRFCEVRAVRFVEAGDVGLEKGRAAARRVFEAERKSAELLSR